MTILLTQRQFDIMSEEVDLFLESLFSEVEREYLGDRAEEPDATEEVYTPQPVQ